MDPATMKPWFDLIVSYGVPLVITVGVLWLAYRYVPKWIDASIESQHSIPVSINKMTDTLREGVDTIKSVRADSTLAREDLDSIKHALKHGASAAEKGLRALSENRTPGVDVVTELGRMKNTLENHNHPRDDA